MADDPRIEPTEEYIRLQFGVSANEANLAALSIIGEADHHDPLRALLADEDRAVNKIGRIIHADWAGDYAHFESSVYHKRYKSAARAVLAALREVADGATR